MKFINTKKKGLTFATTPQGEALGIFKGLALFLRGKRSVLEEELARLPNGRGQATEKIRPVCVLRTGRPWGALLVFVFLLSFLLPLSVSAGVIRKPPNNLGLTAYWNFDEGNGTRAGDSSGNGRNGTVSAAQWVTGKKGKALSFNGASASVNTSRAFSQFITASEGTISVWVKPAATGPVASFSYDGTVIALDIGQYAGITHATISGLDRLWVYNWDGSEDRVGVTYIPGEWIHITWVHSSGTLYAYKNGELVGSTASGNTGSLTNFFNVGGQSGQYFDGSIDEMRTYNRALSATEIATIYRAGSAKIGLIDLSPGTLKNNLTGHWTFDGKDMVSNVADVSGNGRHGILTNFTSTTTAPGKIGQALKFDGVNDSVTTNSVVTNFFSETDGTISVWVRPRGVAADVLSTGIYVAPPAVSSSGIFASFGIVRANNTTLGQDRIWAFNYDGTMDSVGATYNVDEWAHITWVHTGGALSIYKNGEFVGSTASGNSSFFTGNLQIGTNWSGNQGWWNGDIDDVRTWNRALTASEIKQVHNIGAGQKVSTTKTPVGTLQTGLVGHWTFDGPDVDWTTNTVTDKSGNGNNGMIMNIATGTGAVIGKIGQALTFNGTSSYIDLGDKAAWEPSGSTSFSVSLWYKTKRAQDVFFARPRSGIDNYWYIGTAATLFCGGGFGCTQYVTKSYTLPSDNDWHHLVIVLDRSTSPDSLIAYIDGVSQGATTGTLNDTAYWASGSVAIGGTGFASGGTYRQGPMDDVRIYNRALSAGEALQLYRLGK